MFNSLKTSHTAQELLATEAELTTRATAAEAKLSEERKRFQRLREDAKRKLEEEAVGLLKQPRP